jgi:hypothetical protein
MTDEQRSLALSIEEAVALANRLLSAHVDDPEAALNLDDLETYLLRIEALTEQLHAEGHKYSERLRELEQVHERVVARATNELKQSSLALQEHRLRGKSLMKYIDQLPRRLSAFRLKKG